MERTEPGDQRAATQRHQPSWKRSPHEPSNGSSSIVTRTPVEKDSQQRDKPQYSETFPVFSPPKRQRPNISRPALQRTELCFGALVDESQDGAFANGTSHPAEPFSANTVSSALRSVMTRLFRWRNPIDNWPWRSHTAGRQKSGAEPGVTRTRSETTLLHSNNECRHPNKDEPTIACDPLVPRGTSPELRGAPAAQAGHQATADDTPLREPRELPAGSDGGTVETDATKPPIQWAGYPRVEPFSPSMRHDDDGSCTEAASCVPLSYVQQLPWSAGPRPDHHWSPVHWPCPVGLPPDAQGSPQSPCYESATRPKYPPQDHRLASSEQAAAVLPSSSVSVQDSGIGVSPCQCQNTSSGRHENDVSLQGNKEREAAAPATHTSADSTQPQNALSATSHATSSAQTGSSLILAAQVGTAKSASTQSRQLFIARRKSAQTQTMCSDYTHKAGANDDRELQLIAARLPVDEATRPVSTSTRVLPVGPPQPCSSGGQSSLTQSVCRMALKKDTPPASTATFMLKAAKGTDDSQWDPNFQSGYREDFAAPVENTCGSAGKTAFLSAHRPAVLIPSAQRQPAYQECLQRSSIIQATAAERRLFSMPSMHISVASAPDDASSRKQSQSGNVLYSSDIGEPNVEKQVTRTTLSDSSRPEDIEIFHQSLAQRTSEVTSTRCFSTSASHRPSSPLRSSSEPVLRRCFSISAVLRPTPDLTSQSLKGAARRDHSESVRDCAFRKGYSLDHVITNHLNGSLNNSAVSQASDRQMALTNRNASQVSISGHTGTTCTPLVHKQLLNEIVMSNEKTAASPVTSHKSRVFTDPGGSHGDTHGRREDSQQCTERIKSVTSQQVDNIELEPVTSSRVVALTFQASPSIEQNKPPPLVSGATRIPRETVSRKKEAGNVDATSQAIRTQAALPQSDDGIAKSKRSGRPNTSDSTIEIVFRNGAKAAPKALGNAVSEQVLAKSQLLHDSCSVELNQEGRAFKPPMRSFSVSVMDRSRATLVPETTTKGKKLEASAISLVNKVRYCKNPKHNHGEWRSRDYCLTCKNPKHRHGYPDLSLTSYPAGAKRSLRKLGRTELASKVKINYCQNPKHGHYEAIPARKDSTAEARKSLAEAPPDTESGRPVPCCLVLAVAAAILLVLLLLYFLVIKTTVPDTSTSAPGGIYYCDTAFCDREADMIKSLLSSSRGPCEDFYQYVCGKWVQNQQLVGPETGTAVSSDTIIQDRLIGSLHSYLTSQRPPDLQVALALYDACVDQAQAGRAFSSMQDLFRRWKIGRWPTDTLAATKDVWIFAGELLRNIGLKALVDVFVTVNPEQPDNVAIGLGKPSFLFSCNDAARPAVINMFQDALLETMQAVSQSTNQQLVDEVMEVITRLGSSPLEPPVSEVGMRGFDVVRLSDLDQGITDFLMATLPNRSLTPETKVVLKSAGFLQGHLVSAVRESPSRAVMNYAGFLAFINLAPFFLDRYQLLRQLFAKSVLGRTLPDVSHTGRLCLVAVERVLPGCFARLSGQIFRSAGSETIIANKLSQLATSFGRNVEYLAWADDMASVLSRYLLKAHATTAPTHGDNAFCPSSPSSFSTYSSVRFYVDVSRDHERRSLGPLLTADGSGAEAVERSQISTLATYDAAGQRVHVPAGLFNASVPANTSHFSLHFARFAVRFYGALVEMILHRDAVQPSLRYDDDLLSRFEELLDCFEWELRQLPAGLRQSVAPDSATTRGAFLQQTVAVQLAFRAFQELMQIRRTWNFDFRFARLPNLSADQLFFVYYALDNCEAADRVYQEHRGHRLPARYRVNVPLRNTVEFGDTFECAPDSNMVRVTFVPACTVVAVDRWDRDRVL